MRVSDVARQLGVSTSAVRTYARQGRLEHALNPGGQRVFTQEQVDSFLGVEPTPRSVFYVRSSSGSRTLMRAQVEELTQEFGEPIKVYSDSASGLSEKRRGLARLLSSAEKGEFNQVCVTYEDRLSRFGITYLVALLEKDGVKVRVLHEKGSTSLEDELLQDFMSLIASFSGRFYRLRSKTAQKQLLEKANQVLNE